MTWTARSEDFTMTDNYAHMNRLIITPSTRVDLFIESPRVIGPVVLSRIPYARATVVINAFLENGATFVEVSVKGRAALTYRAYEHVEGSR